MIRALTLSLVVAGIGCAAGPPPTPPGPDMELPHRMPTDHSPLWQLADAQGVGSMVQAAPEVYIVVWPGDPYIARIDAFVTWLLGSDFWTGALKEYGIGKGKNMGVITMPSAAPAQLFTKDLEALVKTLTTNGSVPNANANTNIAFFVPASTKVISGGGDSCSYFAGFHNVTSSGSIVYSVMDECDDPLGRVFDGITQVTAHELAEAASDPIPGKGFIGPQTDTEIGDLCNFSQQLAFDVPGDATHPAQRYWVQRFYSFATAKLGNADPCLPVPFQRPFFNATTNPSVLRVNLPQNPPASGFHLETLLEPFAYGDVGKMHWQIISSQFDVQPTGGSVVAGDTVRLSITVPPNVGFNVFEVDIQVESEKAGSNTWPFFIDVCPYQTNCVF